MNDDDDNKVPPPGELVRVVSEIATLDHKSTEQRQRKREDRKQRCELDIAKVTGMSSESKTRAQGMIASMSLPLNDDPARYEEEISYIDSFLAAYASTYTFSGNQTFLQLLKTLTSNRLLRPQINEKYHRHYLCVLRCVRVLTRDSMLLKWFQDEEGCIELLLRRFHNYVTMYYEGRDIPHIPDIVLEMAHIVKRLPSKSRDSRDISRRLLDLGLHKTLILLLGTKSVYCLHAVLSTCAALSSCPSFVDCFSSYPCIPPLLRILSEDKDVFRTLALKVLRPLLSSSAGKAEFQYLHGLVSFVNLINLPAGDIDSRNYRHSEEALYNVLMCLVVMAQNDVHVCQEIAYLGAIPRLVSILETPGTAYSVLIAACKVLRCLAMDDATAYQMRKGHALFVLGQLLCATDKDNDRREIQAYATQILRYLYSVPNNQQALRTLFPMKLMSTFHDIDNYVEDIERYYPFVDQFNEQPWAQQAQVIAAFQQLHDQRGSSKVINGYRVQEVIGKGAFGVVYLVMKGEGTYAMKELPCPDGVMRSEDGDLEIDQSPAQLRNEVDVLKSLDHPHIVRYYDSFVEEGKFYIVMEHVEGQSLLDYINSLQKKKRKMDESLVWKLFVQIVMALQYMHVEEKTTHRDLHPSNILLDKQCRIKITDFGLAKRRASQISVMRTAVGTISYSCPEIIQHKPYTNKADMWSIGCILYQMVMQRPPFGVINPLKQAQDIVAGNYEPMTEGSKYMKAVVGSLLTVNPAERLGVIELSSMLAPFLFAELGMMTSHLDDTDAQLQSEREQREREQRELEHYRAAYYQQVGRLTKGEQKDDSDLLPSLQHSSGDPRSFHTINSALHPAAAAPMLSVDPSRLRLVQDPVDKMLSQVHKLTFVAQLPPSLENNSKAHTFINQYHKHLFGPNSKNNLKEEMKKLSNRSHDMVELEQTTEGMTYLQLSNCLERILHDHNYYQQHSPTPLQQAPIPLHPGRQAMQGRHRAQNGTSNTVGRSPRHCIIPASPMPMPQSVRRSSTRSKQVIFDDQKGKH